MRKEPGCLVLWDQATGLFHEMTGVSWWIRQPGHDI